MEFVAETLNARTHARLRALQKAGLLHDYQPTDVHPTSFCAAAGLRYDVVQSAQKAADATGRIQLIEYEGFTVRVQSNTDDRNPEYIETQHTWVLPEITRRTAMTATGPTIPRRIGDALETVLENL